MQYLVQAPPPAIMVELWNMTGTLNSLSQDKQMSPIFTVSVDYRAHLYDTQFFVAFVCFEIFRNGTISITNYFFEDNVSKGIKDYDHHAPNAWKLLRSIIATPGLN